MVRHFDVGCQIQIHNDIVVMVICPTKLRIINGTALIFGKINTRMGKND
jgi:hypothetical protein